MSINANDVDTKLVSLRISGTANRMSHTLKDDLLKNAKDYTCVIRDMYVNSFPPLLVDHQIVWILAEKDDFNQEFEFMDFTVDLDNPDEFELVLQREHHKNILSVVHYMSEWCVNINRIIAVLGVTAGGDATHHIPSQVPNPNVPYDALDPVEHLKFSFDTAGRITLTCSDAFLSQYFISINPRFAKMIGLPVNLWAGQRVNGGALVSVEDELYDTASAQYDYRFRHDIQYDGGGCFVCFDPFNFFDG